jgi:hypothetical protein
MPTTTTTPSSRHRHPAPHPSTSTSTSTPTSTGTGQGPTPSSTRTQPTAIKRPLKLRTPPKLKRQSPQSSNSSFWSQQPAEQQPPRSPSRQRGYRPQYEGQTHLGVSGPKPDQRRSSRFWVNETPLWRKLSRTLSSDWAGNDGRSNSFAGESRCADDFERPRRHNTT